MANDPVLTAFVALTALAFVAQAVILYGVYRAVQSAQREFQTLRIDLKQRVDPLTQSITEIVSGTREPIRSLTTNLAEMSQILRQRTDYVDAVVADLADRSRVQIMRVDQMVTDFVQKAQSTADVVERGIVAPIHEISAVIKGVRAGLEFLVGRRRASRTSDVSQDEQMFI